MQTTTPYIQTNVSQGSVVALIGGGGHAAVVADAIHRAGGSVAVIYDDEEVALPTPPVGFERAGSTPKGITIKPFRNWPEAAGAPDSPALHIAVGSIQLRADLIEDVEITNAPFITIQDPTAIISTSATIGQGAFVGPAAVINAAAEVGDHAIVNTRATIEHDCVIGENTHIAPGAIICGGASVGRGTLIGAGAVILPGASIGPACVVGAGAVVRGDLAAGSTVAGVPARALNN